MIPVLGRLVLGVNSVGWNPRARIGDFYCATLQTSFEPKRTLETDSKWSLRISQLFFGHRQGEQNILMLEPIEVNILTIGETKSNPGMLHQLVVAARIDFGGHFKCVHDCDNCEAFLGSLMYE